MPSPPAYGQQPSYGSRRHCGPAPAYGAPYGSEPSGRPRRWHGPPLASWARRVGGFLIDALITTVAAVLVGSVSTDLGNVANFAIFLDFGYLTGTTSARPQGARYGAVLREADGTPARCLGAGIGRSFLHILDGLPLGLGYLWPIWDRKNQTFADKIIHSVVIKV